MSTFAKKFTSAVAGLAVVFSMVSPLAGVSAAYTSLEAANELATLGVIVDQSANPAAYRLGDNLPRKEATKVMMNLSSVTVSDVCEGKFADLDASMWACKYAETALANGMVAANTNFRPDDLVSKIEALKMVFQGRGLDRNDNADWRVGYVEAAVEMGIADAAFTDYDTPATRGEMFVWAVNAIDATSVTDGTDDILCEILGTCEETVDPVDPVDPVTPTVGTAVVTKSPESPTNGLAAVNTPRVAMLRFDVTAGTADVTLSKATLLHVGLGDRTNVDNVSIYNSKNERVSKQKDFSNNDLELSFNRDIVVQAGTTQTFTIAATLTDSGSTNTTYQIELVGLEASAAVTGVGIVGAALTPAVVSNSALLAVDDDTASDDITIGEEVVLAGFNIEEKKDNEDVLIRTITLHQNGSADRDYFEDLALYADGVMVASDLSVNNNDELVMNIDYTLAADKDVDFELRGVITGDVGQTVHFEFEENDDVYATGLMTGFNIGFETGKTPATANVANEKTVEGAEIDAVFTRSDIDETKVNVEDVLIGTLELTANTNDYEIKRIAVEVEPSTGTTGDIIEDMNLDGTSYDEVVPATGSTPVRYIFEDITLSQGITEVLPLEFDVNDNTALNGRSVKFTVRILEIRDDENRITYTDGGTNDVSDILSSNSFKSKTIDIENASVELTQTKVNDRTLVLANGAETVLFKGKLSVGDSDSVTVEDIVLDTTSVNTVSDLKDVIDEVTLNIGGKTYKGDVNSTSVEFTSIGHEVAAGSDNVEVLITAVLQDDSSIANGAIIHLALTQADLAFEDSDGEDVLAANVSYYAASSPGARTATILNDQGQLTVAISNNTDYKDDIDDVVLGGTEGVYLAGLEIEAEYEDIDVDSMILTVSGSMDVSTNFENVQLVSSNAGVVADNAIVRYNGTNTIIEFKDFTFPEDDETVDYALMADLAAIDNTGDADAVEAADITISLTAASNVDATGAESNEDITADITGTVASDVVKVVPVMLTITVDQELDDGEEDALITFTVDKGNNIIDNDDIALTSIQFTTGSDFALIDDIQNDDGTSLTFNNSTATVTFTGSLASDLELNNGDEFRITVDAAEDVASLDVVRYGIVYTIDSVPYTISNDKQIDLGTYIKP